ncbi:MAG: MotA/TolQ/ExbB proton channel family protein [Pseudomonadales bacterium]|nr:MotA/TolQ/ExbB proton channel family protein [Pseudomonadales bacterium]
MLSALLNLSLLEQLLNSGGPVMQVLLLVAFVLWSLLLGRLWYKFVEFPGALARCRKAQNQPSFSIAAAQLHLALQQSMGLIKTTIGVCPLLGLVGTVLGMIEIFDVIAYSGVSNAKLMASGVARAILPTMAGMVLAISGMLLFTYIQRWVMHQRRLLSRLSLAWAQKIHEI